MKGKITIYGYHDDVVIEETFSSENDYMQLNARLLELFKRHKIEYTFESQGYNLPD